MRTFTKPTTVRAGIDPPRAADHNNHARAIEELQRALSEPARKTGRRPASGRLPFQITVTPDTLKAAPGTLDGDSIAETTEASPANGTWYLEAKVTINSTTGVVTATAVDWVATESTDTATDYHMTIGSVTVSGGVPDAGSIVQGAFGPIFAIVHGEVDEKWGVLIF